MPEHYSNGPKIQMSKPLLIKGEPLSIDGGYPYDVAIGNIDCGSPMDTEIRLLDCGLLKE